MINGKKVIVCMPAFNASKTLYKTYNEIPFDIVDEVILVDDASNDDTINIAHSIGIKHVIAHKKNTGYGGNQKTCYKKALEERAEIIIMLHPDYQYDPKLIPSMVHMINNGLCDVVLGSRILGNDAIKNGMPYYKYFCNRILTLIQNILMNEKLSEYHTGYRAFSKKIFDKIDLTTNSDDFVFDNQMLAQIFFHRFKVGEISCPAKYFSEASSINFRRSVTYGFGVLKTALIYRLHQWKLYKSKLFN